MDLSGIALALLNMNAAQRAKVFKNAVFEYGEILSSIYNDIYESCIKVYYSSYEPSVYKRHGDLAGFNLYSGFYSGVHNLRVDAQYDSGNLLPYGRGVSSEQVLNAVVNGQRGVKHRVVPRTGSVWPKSWAVSYPNQYSQYGIWQSSGDTIESILDDFDENGVAATSEIFWSLVAQNI